MVARLERLKLAPPSDGCGAANADEMLPLAVIDRSGAIIRDDGHLARAIALDPPNGPLLGDAAAMRLSERIALFLRKVCATGAPLQVHVQGFGTSCTGGFRPGGLATETHLVCAMPFSGVRSLRTGGGRAMARHGALELRAASAESFGFARAVADGLGRLGFASRALDGLETADLIGRRLTSMADAPRQLRPLEVVGTHDEMADLHAGARLARELRAQLEGSATLGPREVTIRGDIEHVCSLAGVGQATSEHWLRPLVDVGVPFTLSIHLAPAGSGKRGGDIAPGPGQLLVSTYLALRVPAGEDTAARLVDALERVSGGLSSAVGVPLHRGDFRQGRLWVATLPIALDPSGPGDRWPAAGLARTLPLLRASCGSPTGIPVGLSPAGVVERLDPWDPQHRTAGLLLAGEGAGQHRIVGTLVGGLASGGVRAVTISTRPPNSPRQPHRVATVPADGFPSIWNVDPQLDDLTGAIGFLTELYSQALDPLSGLEAGERKVLRDAIERVLHLATEAGLPGSGAALAQQLVTTAAVAGVCDPGRHQSPGASELAERLRRLAATPGHEWLMGQGSWTLPADADWIACDAENPNLVALLTWIAMEYTGRALARAYRGGAIAGGALVLDDGDALLARPGSSAWLARLVGKARRLGLVIVVVCREPATLTTVHARRAAQAFSMVTLDCPDQEARDRFAHALDLNANAPAVPGADADRRLAGAVYWANGRRGHGLVLAPEPSSVGGRATTAERDVSLYSEPIVLASANSPYREAVTLARTGAS